jgi:hypothetical protein
MPLQQEKQSCMDLTDEQWEVPRKGVDEVGEGVGQRGRGRRLAKIVASVGFVVLPRRWVVERTIAWIDQ